jgi:hypothetical protein
MPPGYGGAAEAKRDGATWSPAESRVSGHEPGEYRTGPAPGYHALGRATHQHDNYNMESLKWLNPLSRTTKLSWRS